MIDDSASEFVKATFRIFFRDFCTVTFHALCDGQILISSRALEHMDLRQYPLHGSRHPCRHLFAVGARMGSMLRVTASSRGSGPYRLSLLSTRESERRDWWRCAYRKWLISMHPRRAQLLVSQGQAIWSDGAQVWHLRCNRYFWRSEICKHCSQHFGTCRCVSTEQRPLKMKRSVPRTKSIKFPFCWWKVFFFLFTENIIAIIFHASCFFIIRELTIFKNTKFIRWTAIFKE